MIWPQEGRFPAIESAMARDIPRHSRGHFSLSPLGQSGNDGLNMMARNQHFLLISLKNDAKLSKSSKNKKKPKDKTGRQLKPQIPHSDHNPSAT